MLLFSDLLEFIKESKYYNKRKVTLNIFALTVD